MYAPIRPRFENEYAQHRNEVAEAEQDALFAAADANRTTPVEQASSTNTNPGEAMTYEYDETADDPRDSEIASLKAQLAEKDKPVIDKDTLNARIRADAARQKAEQLASESPDERTLRIERINAPSSSAEDFERRMAEEGLGAPRGHYTRMDRR